MKTLAALWIQITVQTYLKLNSLSGPYFLTAMLAWFGYFRQFLSIAKVHSLTKIMSSRSRSHSQIFVKALTFHLLLGLVQYVTQLLTCPWPKGLSWPLTNIISPKSRSQCTGSQNFCPDYNFSMVTKMLMISHDCCPWPKSGQSSFDGRQNQLAVDVVMNCTTVNRLLFAAL